MQLHDICIRALPICLMGDKDELMDACTTGRSIEVVCHICGKAYPFHPDEILTCPGS